MRVLPNEIDFANYLLLVGDGEINDDNDNITLPRKCIVEQNVDVVQNIFGKLISEKKFEELSQCAILAARNIDVDFLNQQIYLGNHQRNFKVKNYVFKELFL
uniref:ATP-dependent DNA helicase n=1 Tax=Trichogramma kaykai TaxID=54128 RepID=A0ABD2WRA4_9HYME